ncbi:MAG: hypothetical protein M1829_003970 [Trizodia sp. TS-e1964]|nr:MAG: hypothetical protein M1829_003970 [Trizodia sp. TS-e1964]
MQLPLHTLLPLLALPLLSSASRTVHDGPLQIYVFDLGTSRSCLGPHGELLDPNPSTQCGAYRVSITPAGKTIVQNRSFPSAKTEFSCALDANSFLNCLVDSALAPLDSGLVWQDGAVPWPGELAGTPPPLVGRVAATDGNPRFEPVRGPGGLVLLKTDVEGGVAIASMPVVLE